MQKNKFGIISDFRNTLFAWAAQGKSVTIPASEKQDLSSSLVAAGMSQFKIFPVKTTSEGFSFKVFFDTSVLRDELDSLREAYMAEPYLGDCLDNEEREDDGEACGGC